MAAAPVDPFTKFNKWPAEGKLNVCIVGAGNLCHVMAGQLGARSGMYSLLYDCHILAQIDSDSLYCWCGRA
jgi:hypothetical protein